jgi:hypothetical protein
MSTAKDVARHLLVVLVKDLGYVQEPMHGHNPMRHQFAWGYVKEHLTADEIETCVGECVKDLRRDGTREMSNISASGNRVQSVVQTGDSSRISDLR